MERIAPETRSVSTLTGATCFSSLILQADKHNKASNTYIVLNLIFSCF